MKKLLTFLTLLTLFFTTAWAAEVTLQAPKPATSTNMDGTNQAATFGLDAAQWSVVGAKNNASNYPGLNKSGYIALYYNADGSSSSTLTISSLTGAIINSITITYTGDTYSNAYVSVNGSNVTGSSGTYSINSTSFVVGNANTTNVQVRISSIVIDYTASGVTTYNVTGTGQTVGGTVTASPAGGVPGTSITITATPDNGYELETLIVDGDDVTSDVNSDNEYTFSMPSHDVAVSATFSAISQGNVEWVLTSPSSLTTGDVVLIVDKDSKRAMSNDNGTSSAPSATSVTLNNDKSKVTAGASTNLHWSVTIYNGNFIFYVPGGGTNYLYCTNTNNGVRVGVGDEYLFKIQDDYLYNIGTSRYLGVYSGQNGYDWRCYTGTDGNIANTDIAFYKRVQTGAHAITVDEDIEHGTVVTDEQSGSQGDVITITVDPDDGYELTELKYNNTAITPTAGNAVSTYTFTMPDADVEITATFSLINYTITIDNAITGGSITTTPSGTATMGQSVTVNITPASGKKVSTVSYTVEGSSIPVEITPTNGTYTFEMPDANVTVTATFIDDKALYIVGTVNGLSGWSATKAVKMTYDGTKYTAKFYVTGNTTNEMGVNAGTFVFATKIGSWNDVNGNRYEPPFADEEGGDKNWWLATSGATNSGNLYKKNYNNSFLIPAGLYEVEVDENISTFNLKTIKDLTPSITPEGATVTVGTTSTVSIAEDFNAFITSCNAFEGTDNNLTVVTPEVKFTVNDEIVNGLSKEVTLNAVGETTVTGKCALVAGETEYVAKSKSETYDVYQPYSVTIESGFTGGTVSFSSTNPNSHYLSTLRAGTTVRVYITPNNEDYELETLSYTPENGDAVNFISSYNEDDEYYYFTMPEANVTINASFEFVGVLTDETYQLVTNFSQLKLGEKYLIVNETAKKALGGNKHAGYDIVITDHKTTISTDSEVSRFVLDGDLSGDLTFYNGTGYLYHTGSSATSVTQEGDGTTDASKWFIGDEDVPNDGIDADGNITLTSCSSARLLRYYSSNSDFRAYASTSNGTDIQLYIRVVEPSKITLRNLIKTGTPGKPYKISNADGLLGVHKIGTSIWFTDEEQAVDYQNPTATAPEEYEYYTVVEPTLEINKSEKDFAQYNWIEVKFPVEKNFTNAYVKNLTGTYSCDNGNPKLTLTVAVDEDNDVVEISSSGLAYELNPYIPANFAGNQEYTNNGETQTFFFSTPKAQEYAQILWAVWNAETETMNMPTTNNYYGFSGSFTINPELNEYSISGLKNNSTYNFKAIIRKNVSKAGPYEVYPTDLNPDVPTAINGVVVNGLVKSVKYVNVAGMVSDVPFQGINIVVTEYTDGTRTTTKMLRK